MVAVCSSGIGPAVGSSGRGLAGGLGIVDVFVVVIVVVVVLWLLFRQRVNQNRNTSQTTVQQQLDANTNTLKSAAPVFAYRIRTPSQFISLASSGADVV